jgi:hypothetical protein
MVLLLKDFRKLFIDLLIGEEGRDSCGTGGQVRHLRVKRPNVAHRLPRGKRALQRKLTSFKDIKDYSTKRIYFKTGREKSGLFFTYIIPLKRLK